MRRKSSKNLLNQLSLNKLEKCKDNIIQFISEEIWNKFIDIIKFDIKNIKDCSEESIVDFYIESIEDLCKEPNKCEYEIGSNKFFDHLKQVARIKLVKKYVPNTYFDNNIDIYFNEVKREYILHPINESENLEVSEENRDIFIKNNLKLVIECAKRYQGNGFPLDDLIQIGNLGLLIAFDKFDSDRANLKSNIINSIVEHIGESFTNQEATNIIKENFKYTKLLDTTLVKIPKEGFNTKEDFINWTDINIKKASFSSIGFIWARATIISTLNKYANIIHAPKSNKSKEQNQVNIIRLDSINPHTEDNYNDNILFQTTNDEFITEDNNIENIERNNMFKELTEKLLIKLNPLDRRIIKKRFGIEYPFEMSLQEIAENEGISMQKVKNSLNNSMNIIANSVSFEDKNTLLELFH